MHRVTNVNPDSRTGDCEECGPAVRVRPRRRADGSLWYWSCRARRPGESTGSIEGKRRRKQRGRIRRYGLTVEEHEELVAVHGERCAICGGADADRRLSIDHCHRSLRVRGLLCGKCNRGLGYFQDSPDLLAAAITYLTRAAL